MAAHDTLWLRCAAHTIANSLHAFKLLGFLASKHYNEIITILSASTTPRLAVVQGHILGRLFITGLWGKTYNLNFTYLREPKAEDLKYVRQMALLNSKPTKVWTLLCARQSDCDGQAFYSDKIPHFKRAVDLEEILKGFIRYYYVPRMLYQHTLVDLEEKFEAKPMKHWSESFRREELARFIIRHMDWLQISGSGRTLCRFLDLTPDELAAWMQQFYADLLVQKDILSPPDKPNDYHNILMCFFNILAMYEPIHLVPMSEAHIRDLHKSATRYVRTGGDTCSFTPLPPIHGHDVSLYLERVYTEILLRFVTSCQAALNHNTWLLTQHIDVYTEMEKVKAWLMPPSKYIHVVANIIFDYVAHQGHMKEVNPIGSVKATNIVPQHTILMVCEYSKCKREVMDAKSRWCEWHMMYPCSVCKKVTSKPLCVEHRCPFSSCTGVASTSPDRTCAKHNVYKRCRFWHPGVVGCAEWCRFYKQMCDMHLCKGCGVKTKFSNDADYCRDCLCDEKVCTQPHIGERRALAGCKLGCGNHACQWKECPILAIGASFCLKHECRRCDKKAWKRQLCHTCFKITCLTSGCVVAPVAGYRYCNEHVCQFEECENNKWCRDHACRKCKGPKSSTEPYCYDCKCSTPTCYKLAVEHGHCEIWPSCTD